MLLFTGDSLKPQNRNLATNLTINPKNPTSQEPPEYSPEQSGFKYAEDFIGLPDGTGIDVSDLESFGYSVLNSNHQGYLQGIYNRF